EWAGSGDLYDKEKQQKPVFKKKLTSVRMKRFGPAHFECRLTPIGDPNMVVEWLHDGKPLAAANRLRMVNEFGYCSLDYEVAYARDSGVITCRASNKFGVDQNSATLIVKDEKGLVEESQLPEGRKGVQRIDEMERQAHEGGPYGVTAEEETEKMKPEIVLLPEPARVLEGDTARFRCRVTGYPAPKVNWYLNGQLIRKSKRYRLRYDGIYYLEITEIKSYDSGEVKVIADNNLGSAEHTVKLEIQQKEDFRTHLRHAAEPKPGDVPSESGKVSFEVVKAEQTAEDSQLKEVMETKNKRHTLTVINAMKDEEGEYMFAAGEKTCRASLTVTGGAIKKPLRDLVVADSQTAVLECQVANPSAEGKWLKDGQLVDYSENVLSEVDGAVRRLVIVITKATDVGEYTYQVATSKTTANLKVEGGTFTHTAVKIKKTLKNLNVVETQEAVFSLELTHENVRGVQWIKNGIEIQPSDKFEISMEGMVHTLKIKNCSTQDESVYSFKLGKLSANARLNILKKPKDVTSLLGATAMFEVGISEDSIPVKWMFKNTELKSNEHYTILSEKRTHKLIIQNVDNSKEGEYTLLVGHLQCSAHLTVESLRVTRPMKNVEVPETQVATFECEVSHFSVPSTWLKNGVELEMSEKFRIVVQGRLHQLKIMNTSRDDSAEYTFVCGNDRVSATLTVNPVLISTMLEDLNAQEKDTVTFEVNVNYEGITYKWLKNGVEIKSTDRCQARCKQLTHTLSLRNVHFGDSAEYTFMAGSATTTDLKITEKKRATFECEVSEPNVQVMWMKDGQELEMSESSDNFVHRLVLPSVRMSDAGEYTAVAGSSIFPESSLHMRESIHALPQTRQEWSHVLPR
uniref:Ig-like domain-containing protein n=1 Tax=Fundulus heteroclitus TaxID=8078 RepID=A0A3Q2Q7Q2_FUNHE